MRVNRVTVLVFLCLCMDLNGCSTNRASIVSADGGILGEDDAPRVSDETDGIICTPNCFGKLCGDDGCGGPCGSCAASQTCNEVTSRCEGGCIPDCTNRQCGSDGCGGSCGKCTDGTVSLFLYPRAATAPRGAYQTVTAVVTGVSDKTVTWKAEGEGTIVGTNPCVVNEPCTVAVYSETKGTVRLTATSNATKTVTDFATLTFTGSPTPATDHPRLMVTSSMLPGLRAKATAGNPLYQTLLDRAKSQIDRNKIWSWSCDSGTGQPSTDQSANYQEKNAHLFAFLSMVAPTQAERDRWGCYGRDVWAYVLTQALNGKPTLRGGNQWSDSSAEFALTTDWLMAGKYLTPDDLGKARRFLAFMAQNALSISYGSTAPVAGLNSPAQFDTGSIWDLSSMRAMGNNYTMSKFLYLVAAALTFDDNPTDDPPLSNTCSADRTTVCPDFSAGSLHAYWNYLVGGMLYRFYAHLEDPAVSWAAYQARYANLPSQPSCMSSDNARHPCFGDGRGGESSEGSWYSYSLYRLRYALNAVTTAGYNDPQKYGPQLSLVTSSWWDMNYVSEIEFLTGRTDNAAFNYWTTGDSHTYFRYPSAFQSLASTLTLDSYSGRTDRSQAVLWPILNAAFGGPSGKITGCRNYCGFTSELVGDYGFNVALDLFIALPATDPSSTPPPDPRPALPLDLYNGSNQHILARTGWSNDDVAFSYYCPPALIDHEHAFCGRFDIFSKGEYITKGRTEFTDYNSNMTTAPQSNLAAIKNVTGTKCSSSGCLVYDAIQAGGQIWHGEQAGFADVLHAELPSYVVAVVDTTNFYNTSSISSIPGYNDVTHASRSLVYLRATNQVVYYDRADTGHAAAKSVHLVTTGKVDLIGNNTASWPTRSGQQQVFLTSLLPEGAILSDAGLVAGGSRQKEDLEPVSTVKIDSGAPTTARFLTVLEFGDKSLNQSKKAAVHSNDGKLFDGAVVGNSLIMFKRKWSETVQAFTYPGSGATRHYLADLKPNSAYTVAQDGSTTSVRSDAAGTLVFDALGTGEVTVAVAVP